MSPTAEPISGRRVNLRRDGDRGAAVTEFVMVSVLLLFLAFAVLQVAVLFYARNIVAASATDGARYAASSNRDASVGGTRATGEVRRGLSAGVADGIPCTGTPGFDPASGLQTTVVRCEGRIKSIFLPLGSFVHISVSAHALTERPS